MSQTVDMDALNKTIAEAFKQHAGDIIGQEHAFSLGYKIAHTAALASLSHTMGVKGDAERYAETLAGNLAAKHYPENTEWKPLEGDLVGLLTQIDNMVAGLVRSALTPTQQPVEKALDDWKAAYQACEEEDGDRRGVLQWMRDAEKALLAALNAEVSK